VERRHRLLVGPRTRAPGVDRVADQLGIAKRVDHALRGDRILDVPGIPDECPARSVRLAEEVRRRPAVELRLEASSAQAIAQRRDRVEHREEVALVIVLLGLVLGQWPATDDHRESVVRRGEPATRADPDVDLEPAIGR
jgi:hypothetical protein